MFVFVLLGVSLVGASATWSACPDGTVPCLFDNKTCISQEQWCDNEYDCADGSDEDFCNGVRKCLDDHFQCDNKKCIPIVTRCNGYDNCGDGSDETCGRSIRNTTDHSKSQLAVVVASHYLLSQRKPDYGWDELTPRVLTALAFAEKYLPIPEKERVSMIKTLELQLLFLLKDGVQNLATLALHINALYAMCQDPRDFHGIDLVERLRSETDKAMKSHFNLPIVLLTLCLANETRSSNFDRLMKIYEDKRNHRIGVKALTVIAMSACNHGVRNGLYDIKRDFIRTAVKEDKNIDIYSRAMICQAYRALGEVSPLQNELLGLQSEDGSFGDLLGTYTVIPALMNSSLADLQCKTRHYKVKPARLSTSDRMSKPERQIDYSLWIPEGKNAGNHTLRITYEGDKSFYDLMKMAERRNPMFKFKYEQLKGTGKKVYYLAGIPNDVEKGLIWSLYRRIPNRIGKNFSQDQFKELYGVEHILPQDGDKFIFHLEHSEM